MPEHTNAGRRDFNGHDDTTFRDVKNVIRIAIRSVESKLAHNKPLQPNANASAE